MNEYYSDPADRVWRDNKDFSKVMHQLRDIIGCQFKEDQVEVQSIVYSNKLRDTIDESLILSMVADFSLEDMCPIVVAKNSDGTYEIIEGLHRFISFLVYSKNSNIYKQKIKVYVMECPEKYRLLVAARFNWNKGLYLTTKEKRRVVDYIYKNGIDLDKASRILGVPLQFLDRLISTEREKERKKDVKRVIGKLIISNGRFRVSIGSEIEEIFFNIELPQFVDQFKTRSTKWFLRVGKKERIALIKSLEDLLNSLKLKNRKFLEKENNIKSLEKSSEEAKQNSG